MIQAACRRRSVRVEGSLPVGALSNAARRALRNDRGVLFDVESIEMVRCALELRSRLDLRCRARQVRAARARATHLLGALESLAAPIRAVVARRSLEENAPRRGCSHSPEEFPRIRVGAPSPGSDAIPPKQAALVRALPIRLERGKY
jgi:hypothetical protein